MDELPDDPISAADDVSVHLGLPTGFLLGLLKEDDWPFVLKIAVLLEAGVYQSLASKFRGLGLDDFFKRLSHSNRVELAAECGAIEQEFISGLKHVASLRNLLAHDIAAVAFDFKSHYRDQDALNSYKSTMMKGATSGKVAVEDGTQVGYREVLVLNPRLTFVRFAVQVLSSVYVSMQHDDLLRTGNAR